MFFVLPFFLGLLNVYGKIGVILGVPLPRSLGSSLSPSSSLSPGSSLSSKYPVGAFLIIGRLVP